MIYVDTSVVLAHLLDENRISPSSLWSQPLISSRLLEYEVWNRIYARGLAQAVAEEARILVSHVSLLSMTGTVLARALEPFPISVRTLDSFHLASMEFLRRRGYVIEFATYDERLKAAAQALDFSLAEL